MESRDKVFMMISIVSFVLLSAITIIYFFTQAPSENFFSPMRPYAGKLVFLSVLSFIMTVAYWVFAPIIEETVDTMTSKHHIMILLISSIIGLIYTILVVFLSILLFPDT